VIQKAGLGDPSAPAFLPDEIEALISLGELDSARPLIDLLEARGRELDRPWALATASRCRALLYAASGDLEASVAAVDVALVHHLRLAMPLELARTLLVAGRIQRRTRDRRIAKESLERSVAIFEELGMPLWAGKVRAELARLGLRRSSGEDLTPTERRIAELAAEGLTNRDVADALFVSPKTVEANLSKVYRKLGIHSRAELGALMGQKSIPEIPAVPK
jgi:DNA-binding NarL/FixJ family response regulator